MVAIKHLRLQKLAIISVEISAAKMRKILDFTYIVPQIVINLPRTCESLHCEGNRIGSVVIEILRYKQTDTQRHRDPITLL